MPSISAGALRSSPDIARRRPRPRIESGIARSPASRNQLFESVGPQVRQIVHRLTRQHGLASADAQDFASFVHLRLLENDAAILRKFKGESSWPTYMNTVVSNLLRDFRDRQWGRWRASAAARRSGPIAVRLEQLINRDGVPFGTAVRHVESELGRAADGQKIWRIAARLPARPRRRFEGGGCLSEIPSRDCPDRDLSRTETSDALGRAVSALEEVLLELNTEDRMILALRFLKGMTVAEVARRTGRPQRPLYRHIPRLLVLVRRRLARRGVDEKVARVALASE